MCNNSFNIVKCVTWASRLYAITSCMGRYFDDCRGFISSCRWSWCWWFCCTSWQSQRSRGDDVLFANATSVVVWKANVASAVCTRHSRDALWWFKSHLDLRWPMFLELLKLWCRMLNGVDGSQSGRNTCPWGENGWIDPWREPLQEGLSLNTSYLIQ